MQTSSRSFRHVAFLTAGVLAPLLPAAAQTPSASPSGAAAAAAPVVPYAPKAPASVTLKDAFKGRFFVGVAVNNGQFTGRDAQGAALVLREFNSITAENVMKMGVIHPRPGNDDSSYEFAPADQFVEFGVKNNLVIIGHNLCWHSQAPAWINQQANAPTITKEELTQWLHDHIMKVAGRYKGKIHGWDVVNEAINDGAGDYRQSIFYKVIGKEYLVMAFKWAHEADPNAELYYNDYNLDASDAKRATAIELVKYLRENGAVIHGIGMQGHYNMEGPSIAKIDETIKLFSDLGLKVHITELDVRANAGPNAVLTGAVGGGGGAPNAPAAQPARGAGQPGAAPVAGAAPGAGAPGRGGRGRGPAGPPPPLTAAQQEALSKRYGEIFQVFLKHKSVVRVTLWGLRDADSWRRPNSPLLFDDAYGRKPAYDGVIDALAQVK